MDLPAKLGPTTRVIDVGPTDDGVAAALAAGGVDRYLGLVPPERLDAVRAASSVPGHRFQPLLDASAVHRNNADLLVLRGPATRRLWTPGALSHVGTIAVHVRSPREAADLVAAAAAGRLTGKLRPLGRWTCGQDSFLVFRGRGRRRPAARHYLSPALGVQGFAERTAAAGLEYVVLRWFDRLPHIDPGEDLDVLVADADHEKLAQLLDDEPGTIPVDLYSETGLTGADFQGVAYYPPPVARAILAGAVTHGSGCRVPAPEDHLRSLAYHVTYHKGARSGLPSEVLDGVEPDPEHDYADVLGRLAATVGVEVDLTLEGLDRYLDAEGWRPPPDTLRRLSSANQWVRTSLLRARGEQPFTTEPQVTTFLVRERALGVLTLEEIERELDHLGFDVLASRRLDADAARRCAAQARGGNWGRGPFTVSGGPPVHVVVALHHGPRLPRPALRSRYPHLTNEDVVHAKTRIRDLVAARTGPSEAFNPLHSSDDEPEAWEYAELTLPGEVEQLRAEVDRRRAAYATSAPVVELLSLGRRAKVEVVDHGAGPVVRKTFGEGYRRFMERELEGIRTLGPQVAAMPRLLATGPNWFELPYYRNTLTAERDRGLVPLRVVRQMLETLRQIHAQGYDVIDAKPDNFLLDPEHGLRIIDLEFLHRYEGDPPAFAKSYMFAGVPDGYDGDVPFRWSYDWNWQRTTGLSPQALLTGSALRQHRERAAWRAKVAATGPASPARSAARVARNRLRAGRRAAGVRYRSWTARRAGQAV